MVYLNGALVCNKSATQKVVATSTTEAETNAMVSCAQDMIFVKKQIEQIGLKVKLPMKLECDNKGAVYLANSYQVTGRTKHMDTKVHWLRELKENNVLRVEWIPTDENEADINTKNVNGTLFAKHTAKFMTG